MLNPRLSKLIRDLKSTSGRSLMMVAAMALSLFVLATVLAAYSILNREIALNYQRTNPAALTIETERVDDSLVLAAREFPGITAAEARGSILARAKTADGSWMPLRFFIIRDFLAWRIGVAEPDGGAWPPQSGTIALERTALDLFHLKIGQTMVVKLPDGKEQSVLVSAALHDPGLAPSWQERTGYGYLDFQTYAQLGGSPVPRQLKITVEPKLYTAAGTNEMAGAIGNWIAATGRHVEEIQLPPPGKHPHQSQMGAILTVLFVFSLLGILLSAVLVATMVSGLMAREIRQIGVMKTIGATSAQIAKMYLSQVWLLSLVALAVALPLGAMAAQGLSVTIGNLLNFTIYDATAPIMVYLLVVLAGLLFPLAACLIPVARSSRVTIRQALDDHGTGNTVAAYTGAVRLAWLTKFLDRTLLLAIRNSFRQKKRLALMLTLLSVAGSLFIAALSVREAWELMLDDSFKSRKYDFEIRTQAPQSEAEMREVFSRSPGVARFESWKMAAVAPDHGSSIEISHIYPDGGHGSFVLWGLPPKTAMVDFPLLAGRWLLPGETDGVVLNQLALAQFPGLRPGGKVELTSDGKRSAWNLVGVVRDIGPASAFVSANAFPQNLVAGGWGNSFRMVSEGHDIASRAQAISAVQARLEALSIGINLVIADSEYRNAISDHIFILIFTLVSMAILMGLVGLLGLSSVTATNVAERTREFGVMRTIGATPWAIVRNVSGESLFTALLSAIGAIGLAVPLSGFLGQLLGTLAFMTPLPPHISGFALAIWLAALLLGSLVASASPALSAARLSIRETLAYE